MKKLLNGQKKIKKIFCVLIIVFVIVFVLRWAYEIYFSNNDVQINYYGGMTVNYAPYDDSRRFSSNIATEKIHKEDSGGQTVTIDQKYDKTASMSSSTTDFKNDNQKLRQIIAESDAVIQREDLRGLEGDQRLSLTIGVTPDRFDGLVESIRPIGNLQYFAVNKIDKTSEYMSLMAEQETLKKTRDSYIALKDKGGSIQDLLLLESKILDVEEKLQSLGVDIGLFSTEYSFCTVNFTLNEGVKQTISVRFILTCAKSSFFWTLMLFAFGVFLILAALAAIAVGIALHNFIRKMTAKSTIVKIFDDNEDKKLE